MSSPREPSVETLTAEIRVLQVGSKPVTLSAARQLDHADPSEIQAFGRVRIDAKPAKGMIEVIGSADGVLAKSSASSRRVECPGYRTQPERRAYGLPVAVCSRHRGTSAADAVGKRHEWTEYTPVAGALRSMGGPAADRPRGAPLASRRAVACYIRRVGGSSRSAASDS